MAHTATPSTLPDPKSRLNLGLSGLQVSPLCLGITQPDTVLEAFDSGVNFFFLTADLHWPLYEGLRQGLVKLFERGKSVRDQVVVGVVSYLEEPLFGVLQFHEVIQSVPGLERVDLLIAGAVPDDPSFFARFNSIFKARAGGHCGSRAIGGSFHHRPSALTSINAQCLDVHFIRYNTAHPGALQDIFPYVRPDRTGLIYNFKTTMSYVTPDQFRTLGLGDRHWLPNVTDYYRFVLSAPTLDGLLCSPQTPDEFRQLLDALKEGPLTMEEQNYMRWLSSTVNPRYF